MVKILPSINWPISNSENLEAIEAFFSERTSFRLSGFTSKKAVLIDFETRDWWFSPSSSWDLGIKPLNPLALGLISLKN